VQAEWDWPERYPKHDTVKRYLEFVTDRLALRDDIQLNTRVESAAYDAATNLWTVVASDSTSYTCTYFITALGHLSIPINPAIAGLDTFEGQILHTGWWPNESVDFAGRRVAVIGTGSSGVQAAPRIAEEAAHLTVFQRTPNFVVPSQNYKIDADQQREIKESYDQIWDRTRQHVFGFPMNPAGRMYDDVSDGEREKIFEEGWEKGGFYFVFETFDDMIVDPRTNEAASEFIRSKIRQIVKDPATAETLCPSGYPFVAKRPVVGNGYYEMYNRGNVTLVDAKSDPIEAVTPTGIRLASGAVHEFDVLVLATGFDAATGALSKIDVRGLEGLALADVWAEGPNTYLGVGIPRFPNMFMVGGPQSAYANIPVVIEEVAEFIGMAISSIEEGEHTRIEATEQATTEWVAHANEVFNMTLLREGGDVGSWYVGANVPGKPQRLLFYFGGASAYFAKCKEVADSGFAGFELQK